MQKYLSLFLLLIVLHFPSGQLSAQDSLRWYVRPHMVVSSGEIVPLWLHTNQFGTVNNFGNGAISTLVGANYQKTLGKQLAFTAGIEGFASEEWDNKALSQLYASLKWGPAQLIVGKKNLDYLNDRNQEMPFLNFRNIRPFPNVSFGFFDYTNIPLLQGFLQFKASFVQGILTGDRDPIGVDKPLYHFKSLYIKTGRFPLQLFAGMNHGVIFGGTMQDGTKIPVDLYNTYLINASEKVGKVLPGEGENKPGEHMGFVDMGALLEIQKTTLSFTYEKVMTDYSGLVRSDDHMIILHLAREGKYGISEIGYEYGYTVHQSGIGLGDRYYEKIQDYTAFLSDNFNYTGEPVGTFDEFTRILYSYTGNDGKYSGRDSYFNNYIYPLGHSFGEHFFGYPLMHNSQQISYFKDFNGQYFGNIGNNRIKSHHFSVAGWLTPQLHYSAKATFTKNYGTYSGFYLREFKERPDYYFRGGKTQSYFLFRLEYDKKNSPVSFFGSLGVDTGNLYDSYGLMLGVNYSVSSQVKRKK